MNHLESLRRIVKLRRSSWARELETFLESAPDYQDIDKVEYFAIGKADLYGIYVNGNRVGEAVWGKAAAGQLADWLHYNRELFNLIKRK